METVCRQGLLYSCEHSRVSWGFHCNSAATLVSGFYGMCFLPVACQSRLMRRAEMAVITFCSVLITIGLCIISLTISNSPFCPHRVLMCFVWIWEQTAIISLCNSNWLPPPPQRDGVCLPRGTDWIFIYNQVNGFPRSIPDQSMSDYGGHSGTLTAFSPSTSVSPGQDHSTSAPNSSSSTGWSYQKEKGAKPGNIQRTVLFQKSGSTGQKNASALEFSI